MNGEKLVGCAEKATAFIWFNLMLILCGSVLGYGVSTGAMPNLKRFIDSTDISAVTKGLSFLLGVLIALPISLWLTGKVVGLWERLHKPE